MLLRASFSCWLLVSLCGSPAGAQTYFLNGAAAATGNGCYAITPNAAWQNGTVWYAQQLDLSEPFDLSFDMSFGSADATGADGMVFVLQTVGTTAMGFDGGGMGFGGFDPSFGIEFDTFQNNVPNDPNNNNNDPAYDHIAFLRDGNVNHLTADNLAGPVQANSGSSNIEDGQVHHVRITWDPDIQTVQCYFDCQLRLTDQIDLIQGIFGGSTQVYWGFTGSTGFYYNQQSVCLSDYILGAEDPDPICPGQSTTLIASGNVNGTYAWTPADGVDDPFAQATSVTPAATTTYTVTYTDPCGTTQQQEITVQVIEPYTVLAPEDLTMCEGTDTVITAVSSGSLPSFQWATTDGTIAGPGTGSAVTISSGGTYTVTVATPEGCSSSDTIVVTTTPQPDWWEPEAVYSLCPGGSIELEASAGPWEITWTPGGETANTVTISEAGDFALGYADPWCSASFPFEVILLPTEGLDLGPDVTICSDQTVVLDAGIVVEWSTGSTASSIEVSTAGIYSYSSSESGCVTGDTISVSVDLLPVVELGPDTDLCEGESLLLSIPYEGTWTNGTTGSSLEVNDAGSYGVSVTNGVCVATDMVEVTGISMPVVDLGESVTWCSGETFTLSAVDPQNTFVLWSTGEETPVLEVSSSGTYVVQVFNECGSATDSVDVIFEECNYFIHVPNAFTPDNDGINDAWIPAFYNVEKAEVLIFDRWGAVIYRERYPFIAWMANVQGGTHYVPSGVYPYLLTYTSATGESDKLQGHIVVIR